MSRRTGLGTLFRGPRGGGSTAPGQPDMNSKVVVRQRRDEHTCKIVERTQRSRDRRAFMTVAPEDRVTAFIAADPDSIWDMISDITRMGQWSPECYRAMWLTSRRGKARLFLGLNKDRGLRWRSPAIVPARERGRGFA